MDFTELYNFKFSCTPDVSEFEWTVKINHCCRKSSRILIAGNKIKNTFCQADYVIKIILTKKTIRVKILEHWGLLQSWADNHIYDNWTCCFCSSLDLYYLEHSEGLNIKTLYEQHIIPFFYNQTYHSVYWEWILWEYGHGDIWTLERYGMEEIPDSNMTKITLSLLSNEMREIIIKTQYTYKSTIPINAQKGLIELRKNIKTLLPFNFK